MNLDPRTLLFSLILINSLIVLSLFVAISGRNDERERDGMGKWAIAMLLETLTWGLVAARGHIPDAFSIIVANGLKAGAHALILAAICEFQRRAPPRWQYFAPVALTLVVSAVLVDDIRGRFIWVGIIYAFQIGLIARALLTDPETRSGQAWKLLFGGATMIVLVLGLRAFVAMSGQAKLAQPQNTFSPHWVQIISFIGAMATALLGSIGFMLMVKERTDRAVLHLAMTDSLTQIPNRRALMDFAERALADRRGGPIAMLMIDVDNFKHINDTFGHLAGDEVLRNVASLLEKRLRGHDLLGRYGGEEFCVVAPDTNVEGALTLAESLRESIAATPLGTDRGEVSASISIGISFRPSNAAAELKQLLAEADTALYAAKQAGRNQVASYCAQPTQ